MNTKLTQNKHTKKEQSNTLQSSKKVGIVDTQNEDNLNILGIYQEDLNSIFNNSGPLAKINEFQVHYSAAVLRYTAEDNSIFSITIPTVFYNYKQQVASSSIDFELTDVISTNKIIEPIHNIKVNAIKSIKEAILIKVQKFIPEITNLKIFSSYYNSVHRHPGSSKHQGFSGTDLDTNIKNPGVVYPIQETKETPIPNIASIMCIEGKNCILAHTEYREVLGNYTDGIVYEKNNIVSVVLNTQKEPSKIKQLFTVPIKNNSYVLCDDVNIQPFYKSSYYYSNDESNNTISTIQTDIIKEMMEDILISFNLKAEVKTIIAKNLEQKSYCYSHNKIQKVDTKNKTNKNTNKTKNCTINTKDRPYDNIEEYYDSIFNDIDDIDNIIK